MRYAENNKYYVSLIFINVLEHNNNVGENLIEAIWDETIGTKHYSWSYKTEIPHFSFEIFEDGEPYCLGIVFSVDDLK